MEWQLIRTAAARYGVEKIVAVDVGARWGIGDRWAEISSLVDVYGFDPDIAECERLNAQSSANVKYVPFALGEETRSAKLHVAENPGCSSLYPPDGDVAALLPESACITQTGTQEVSLTSFDAWRQQSGVPAPTVFKLDTQGSELGVLMGAAAALPEAQLLEIEVEFNPLYQGQPLFSDVDRYLRGQGFVLWHLSNLVHYSNRSLPGLSLRMEDVSHFDSQPLIHQRGAGQLYWGHAYFVRQELSPASPRSISPAQALRVATVALAYGLLDLAYIAVAKASDEMDAVLRQDLLAAIRQKSVRQADASQASDSTTLADSTRTLLTRGAKAIAKKLGAT